MIPGKIVRFLEERANIATSATRDRELRPHGHRVTGWRVSADRETMACLIPALFLDHLLASLQDNGHLAVTIEEFPSHETYQFKGRYLRHREIDKEDLAMQARMRDRWVKGVRTVFAEIPEDVLRDYILEPALAVEFQVQEIYLQTPGPGTGTRLVPSREA
jgi:hypothetical protein